MMSFGHLTSTDDFKFNPTQSTMHSQPNHKEKEKASRWGTSQVSFFFYDNE
jgi:hypothetical protein